MKHRRIKEEEPMTNAQTADLFAGVVRDNNTHTVRIVSNGARAFEGASAADDLATNRQHLDTFGYTEHTWDDVDRNNNRVTLTWFAKDGRSVWLYETSYFTRVACEVCPKDWAQWAERYAVVVNTEGTSTLPVAYCGRHLDDMRRNVRDMVTVTLHTSEPLRIGQHD